MKSFNFEENKKLIKKEIYNKLSILAGFVSVMIALGIICYLLSLSIFISFSEKLSFWEVYNQLFQLINFGKSSIEEIFAGYSIILFSTLSIFSAFLYAGILIFLKKIEYLRNNYEYLREQIYDLLTMLIFLFGFLPIIVGFLITKDNETLLSEISNLYLVSLIGILPPYLYSSISKIYYATEEKLFSKSLINHMEKKINNNK